MTTDDKQMLVMDSRNRATRVFLVNIIVDAVTALSITIREIMETSPGHDFSSEIMLTMLGKTLAATVGSYLLRRYGDASGVWTPLPPAPQPEPAEPIKPIEPIDPDAGEKPFEADA